MKQVLDLIGKDQLNEAIDILSNISSVSDEILKELIALKSRLTELNRNNRKGLIDEKEKAFAKNKIRDALIELTFALRKQANQITRKVPAFEEKFSIVFEKLHLPFIDAQYSGTNLLSLNFSFGVVVKNISAETINDFTIEVRISKLLLNADLNLPTEDINQLLKDGDYEIFSIPSKGKIYPSETVRLMSKFKIRLDYYSSRHAMKNPTLIKIFQINGNIDYECDIFDYAIADGIDYSVESFHR